MLIIIFDFVEFLVSFENVKDIPVLHIFRLSNSFGSVIEVLLHKHLWYTYNSKYRFGTNPQHLFLFFKRINEEKSVVQKAVNNFFTFLYTTRS